MNAAIEQVYASLKKIFRGELLRPRDHAFAEARTIWNCMVARTPGLIARCADTVDVQSAVRAGVAVGVLAAVRCGGHSLAGYSTCDGGLVIDLSRMRDVTVDPTARRARFAGGCLLGSVDSATHQHGLVFPSGVVSHTGAAGLVLGGGFGWLTRLHGLSCDNVEGFTLVTAEGSVLRANHTENSDLFWALRGGGGNFGVVTEFDVHLHPLQAVVLGEAFSPEDEIRSVLRRWRDFMPESPDNLRWSLSLRLAPKTENVPPEIRGCPVLSHAAVWAGDLDEGARCIERVLSGGSCVGVSNRALSFLSLQTMADHEFPHGRRYYTKSGYFKSLDDASIDRMVASLADIPSPDSQIELAYLGGAAARVSAADTAFGDRSSPYVINLLGNWSEPADDAANVAWVRSLFQDLRPDMAPGVYINFMSGDEDDRVPEAYRDRWDRLISVKSRYDPNNFFRLNQNIPTQKASAPQKAGARPA
jgi:FAD binding domain/Berberine and berberine like